VLGVLGEHGGEVAAERHLRTLGRLKHPYLLDPRQQSCQGADHDPIQLIALTSFHRAKGATPKALIVASQNFYTIHSKTVGCSGGGDRNNPRLAFQRLTK